jgi:hypothetical protein
MTIDPFMGAATTPETVHIKTIRRRHILTKVFFWSFRQIVVREKQ